MLRVQSKSFGCTHCQPCTCKCRRTLCDMRYAVYKLNAFIHAHTYTHNQTFFFIFNVILYHMRTKAIKTLTLHTCVHSVYVLVQHSVLRTPQETRPRQESTHIFLSCLTIDVHTVRTYVRTNIGSQPNKGRADGQRVLRCERRSDG